MARWGDSKVRTTEPATSVHNHWKTIVCKNVKFEFTLLFALNKQKQIRATACNGIIFLSFHRLTG